MGLESTDTIGGLDPTWPLDSDPTNQGNNHMQLIKGVLKNMFPGKDTPEGEPGSGTGFTTRILATEAEINHLQGATSAIQDQLDELTRRDTVMQGMVHAPVNLSILVNIGTDPIPDMTGWITDEEHNGKMCIIHSGQGNGGENSPYSFNHTHVIPETVLEEKHIPQHRHTMPRLAYATFSPGGGHTAWANEAFYPVGETDLWPPNPNVGHTHGNNGNAQTTTWQPLYKAMRMMKRETIPDIPPPETLI